MVRDSFEVRRVVIHDLPGWQVTSYGNGLAYEVANKRLSRAVFFQGDDADIFRTSFEALATVSNGPMLNYADALAWIWSDYSECSEDWGIRDN